MLTFVIVSRVVGMRDKCRAVLDMVGFVSRVGGGD